MKTILKGVTPPILWQIARKLRHRKVAEGLYWTGDYPDWQTAVAASSGYDQDAIFVKVRDAARAVRDGRALWERDSVLFYHEEYNVLLLAALMSVAAWNKGRLRVLDFGGALGSSYMQHRPFWGQLEEIRWNIVEQPHVAACGREEFEDVTLRFWPSLEECLAATAVDVVLFSSVLQYLENPYGLLEQTLSSSPAGLFIDRTFFAPQGEKITVQHVPEEIYKATYPCRWLDKSRVEAIIRRYFDGPITWFPSYGYPEEYRSCFVRNG